MQNPDVIENGSLEPRLTKIMLKYMYTIAPMVMHRY